MSNCSSQCYLRYEFNPVKYFRIPYAFRANVYCTAVRHGNREDWNYLLEHLKAGDLPDYEKANILYGLSCAREAWQIQYYLNYVIGIEKELATHIKDALVNPNGHWIAWNFVKENWEVISSK